MRDLRQDYLTFARPLWRNPWWLPLCCGRWAGQEASRMEFELGQTYSGYKFLDVVRRSRSAVQYRVQNTLAQRVESLRTLTAAAARRSRCRRAVPA